MSIITQSREESIRQQGDILRAAAIAKGSYLKPATIVFGAWSVSLSFGTKQEMERLIPLENAERERLKMPKMERGRTANTWHFSAKIIVPEEVIQPEASTELGLLASSVGVPAEQIATPIEVTLRGARDTVQWQWRDE
jgi:hypothetical protein